MSHTNSPTVADLPAQFQTPPSRLAPACDFLQTKFPGWLFLPTGVRAVDRYTLRSLVHEDGSHCEHRDYDKKPPFEAGVPLPPCDEGRPTIFMVSRLNPARERETLVSAKSAAARFLGGLPDAE